MTRFQALTNTVLDEELEMLRDRLGLATNQKADLLREVSSLAAWVVRQAEQGRTIEARRGDEVEELTHPAVERVRAERAKAVGTTLRLSDEEVRNLAAVLDRGFNPPPALRAVLARLASPKRHAPKLRWRKRVA